MEYTASIAFLYSIVAGVVNGSFALPVKHIKTWDFEHIWLNFAVWGFLVLPWVTILLLDPQSVHVYKIIPSHFWLILLIGGFLFGVGQIAFAIALSAIGFSLGFAIDIGFGTALGVLLPLVTLNPNQIFSAAGIITLLGILFIIIGLFIFFIAGRQRDKEKQSSDLSQGNSRALKNRYLIGVSLAILAGVFSAGQNYTFALTTHARQLALTMGINPLAAAIIIWPPFLTCSFIPYALYMLRLHAKNNSFSVYSVSNLVKNNFYGFMMGLFWFGSLIMYSKAFLLLGDLGAIIAWPLFMAFIILTSNFWGWRHHEWQGCRLNVKRNVVLSILALVVAVVILAYGASLPR